MAEDYSGMTVNERLFAAGLLARYESALASADLDEVSRLLAEVGLTRDSDGMSWSMKEVG